MTKIHTILIFTFLAAVAVVPWLLNAAFAPLTPPAFAETLTAYYPTEWARSTREAAEEFQATSVFVTLPPDPAFDSGAMSTPYPVANTLSDPILVGLSHSGALGAFYPVYFSSLLSLPAINLQPTVFLTESPTVPIVSLTIEPTPTIPLPVARTATPEPPIVVLVQLSNEKIAELAQSRLSGLIDPNVSIMPNEIIITGQVSSFGPLTQGITVRGVLRVTDEKIVMDVQYVERNGADVTSNPDGQAAKGLINNWLLDLQFGQRVQQLIVGEGQILYIAIQTRGIEARVPYTIINISIEPTAVVTALPAGLETSPEATISPQITAAPTVRAESAGRMVVITPLPTYPVFTLTPSPLPLPTNTLAPGQPSPTPTPSIVPPVARQPEAGTSSFTYANPVSSLSNQTIGAISGATISFTHDGVIIIQGNLQSIAPIDGVSGTVEIQMRLELREEQLVPVVEVINVNNVELGNAVQGIIGNELQEMLGEWWRAAGGMGRFFMR